MDKLHNVNSSVNEKSDEVFEKLERRVCDIEKRLDMFERYINSTAITGDALQMFHEMKESLKKGATPK